MPYLAHEIVLEGTSIKIDGIEFPWFLIKSSINASHDPGDFCEVTVTIICERVEMEMGRKS